MVVVAFLQVFVDRVATGDMVGNIVDDITGQGPAVILPWDELGPTKSPLNVPPAMIVYATPHCSPLTVTVADWLLLVIGAVPVIIIIFAKTLRMCTYVCKHWYYRVQAFKHGIYVSMNIHTYIYYLLLKQCMKHIHMYLMSISSFPRSSADYH